MSGDHAYFNDAEAPHAHVIPLWVYWGVFFALLGLTVATVAVILVDLGPFNIVVALAIAVAKATLVGAIFMHLWWDELLNTVIVLLSLVFMSIFLMFCLIDENSRGMVDPVKENFLIRNEVVEQHQLENPDAPQLRAFKDQWWQTVEYDKLHSVETHH